MVGDYIRDASLSEFFAEPMLSVPAAHCVELSCKPATESKYCGHADIGIDANNIEHSKQDQ